MYTDVLFGANRLYVKQFVRERDRTDSWTVEFSKIRISSFFIFFFSFLLL